MLVSIPGLLTTPAAVVSFELLTRVMKLKVGLQPLGNTPTLKSEERKP